MDVNLNYCQVCNEWLGPDDYDGICCECNDAICEYCLGGGEVEDYSHLLPPVDGDWPMVQCPRCNGTGKEPEQEQS